jgi:hypothetical protein
MSLAGRMSRVVLLLVTPIWIAGCAASQQAGDSHIAGGGTGQGSPCSNGNGSENRQAPIVCVDDSQRTLSVWPEPVHVHDVQTGGGKPVMVHWYTRSGGGDLRVEIEPGCVVQETCDGRGHCSARSVPGKGRRECKYDIWINGGQHDRLDPTVVIQPCCT